MPEDTVVPHCEFNELNVESALRKSIANDEHVAILFLSGSYRRINSMSAYIYRYKNHRILPYSVAFLQQKMYHSF